MLNSLKNSVFRGLVILVAVAGAWAYWEMNNKYAALVHRLNQLHSSPILTSKPVASFAGQESIHDALDVQIQGLDRKLVGLQQKLALLAQQLERTAAWQGAASVSNGPAHHTSGPIENSKKSPRKFFQQPQTPSVGDRADELWGRYSREARNDEWALSVETAIQSAFNNVPELANVRIEELDCRTTMCRLTWEFVKDLTSEESFILENELVAAVGAAGLSRGTQISNGNEIEGFFFLNDTQSPPISKERLIP